MNSNYNNDPSDSFSPDYLDQISTYQPEKRKSNILLYIIIFIGIGIVIFVLFILMNSGNANEISLERLGHKFYNLKTVSEESQVKIKNSQLRALNSQLTAQLTKINREITQPLSSLSITIEESTSKTANEESETLKVLNEGIENSRLNDTLDRDYSREMSYQMEKILVIMKAINDDSPETDIKNFIDNNYSDFELLKDAFIKYSETSL